MSRFWVAIALAAVCPLALANVHTSPAAAGAAVVGQDVGRPGDTEVSGVFAVIWGDPPPGSRLAPRRTFTLTEDDGFVTELAIDETTANSAGGLTALNRKRVTVKGPFQGRGQAGQAALQVGTPVVRVSSIVAAGPSAAPAPGVVEAGVSGSQPWVTILCKFPDYPAEPKTLAYAKGMYASSYPGLDHYWREVSFNIVNVVGSDAVGWFTLPHPRSYYIYDSDGDGRPELDFGRAATDCTAAADPYVYFPTFVGINMFFSYDLDGYSWGGSWGGLLDGVWKYFRTTWEPPWGYTDITVMSHEMGHGFGLPHSSGAYGATYDNPWDVMSDTGSNCDRLRDATYGCLGQDTIAYHKDLLGWFGSGQRYQASAGTSATITLENLAAPASSTQYQMVTVPISGSSRFYTVEARKRVGYDTKLIGEGVIIHEVDPARTIPAHVVDADGNGNNNDAGAIWVPGEVFTDAAAQVRVTVNSATATGFVVTVRNGATRVISLGGNLAFGTVPVGTTATRTLTISNGGTDPLTVTGIAYPAGFRGAWAGVVAAGGSQDVSVTFAPASLGAYSGTLTVTSDATSGTNTWPVSGTGSASKVISLGATLSFGSVPVNSTAARTLTIANRGTDPLTVAGIAYPAGFSGPTWSGTIPGGGSQDVTVTFTPTAARGYRGDVVVSADQTNGTNTTLAAGTGVLDFDSDGRPEVLWHNQSSGSLYLWFMNGVQRTAGSYLTPSSVSPDWQVRGIADFNADGKLDVLFHNQVSGALYVWLMDGTSRASASYLTPSSVPATWQIGGVADFNADGKPDILWHNQTNGQLYVWFMNGTTQTGGAYLTPSSVSPEWQIRGLGDLDGDGQPDIVWQNQTNGQLYVWFMNGVTRARAGYLTPSSVSGSWLLAKVADFNGDGKVDILWHNQASGQLYVWFMDGATQVSGAYLSPSSVSADWQVRQ
jgi:M6 family metalloprotease-like protein